MSAIPSSTRRRRGILAFLPETLHYFPPNPASWKLAAASRRRKRRRPQEQEGPCQQVSTNSINLDTVAFLLVDPQQPSSRKWLDLLQKRLSQQSTVVGIVLLMNDHDSSILQHSGLYTCSLTSTLQMTLSMSVCPALAVAKHGIKVSAATEEMALEWNTVVEEGEEDPVLEAWKHGKSALTWSQKALATAIMPSSCLAM